MLDSTAQKLDSTPPKLDSTPPKREAFGRFQLVERIGSGGMATVHRAVQRGEGGFERELVVKRILPQLASEQQFVRMFIEEAKLGAHLNHPNIVQIYDLGQIKSRYFMAMEYIEGVSLLRVLRCHGPDNLLPTNLAAHIVLQICNGLDYAHSLTLEDGRPMCLVHRDVSPANVMLSRHGCVKLLDFGIAKAAGVLEREETRTGTLKGKLAYMSPEQVEGHPLTARSDLFVTGILLWEALTGRRLFKGANDYQTLCNVVRAEVAPPSSLRPELPAILDDICLRALQKKPKERYETAEQMADDLEELVLRDEPVGPSQLAEFVEMVRATPRKDSRPSPSERGSKPGEVALSATDPLPQSAEASASETSSPTTSSSSEVAPKSARQWVWTTIAFVGGAVLATALMLGIFWLTGLLKAH